MDGRLTALDVVNGGRPLWSFDTHAPLVSGTLHNMKVLLDGADVYRVIPSVHGHLYMYHERTGALRPVPVDAGQLLSSSVRFGDDVLAGSVAVDTTGLDIHTGRVAYVCTPRGCDQVHRIV
jgi:hypothetical protein